MKDETQGVQPNVYITIICDLLESLENYPWHESMACLRISKVLTLELATRLLEACLEFASSRSTTMSYRNQIKTFFEARIENRRKQSYFYRRRCWRCANHCGIRRIRRTVDDTLYATGSPVASYHNVSGDKQLETISSPLSMPRAPRTEPPTPQTIGTS